MGTSLSDVFESSVLRIYCDLSIYFHNIIIFIQSASIPFLSFISSNHCFSNHWFSFMYTRNYFYSRDLFKSRHTFHIFMSQIN